MDRIEALRAFLKEDPTDAFSRFALAQELRWANQPEEALTVFEELVTDQPEYVGTYYHLGQLYEELGRLDDAIETYRTGIDRATDAGDLHARAELKTVLLEAQGIGLDD